jgi:hypothetical protein
MEMITQTITMNKETLNELLTELLQTVVNDDCRLKQLDKSIDPSSYSQAIHLTKTIIEYVNQQN